MVQKAKELNLQKFLCREKIVIKMEIPKESVMSQIPT